MRPPLLKERFHSSLQSADFQGIFWIEMGWFRNLSANRKIIQRISDLEEDMEIVKRTLRKSDLELSEWYDKVRHALSRLAKRRDIVEEATETAEEDAVPLTDSSSDGLTAAQKQWNQRILNARGMRGS